MVACGVQQEKEKQEKKAKKKKEKLKKEKKEKKERAGSVNEEEEREKAVIMNFIESLSHGEMTAELGTLAFSFSVSFQKCSSHRFVHSQRQSRTRPTRTRWRSRSPRSSSTLSPGTQSISKYRNIEIISHLYKNI